MLTPLSQQHSRHMHTGQKGVVLLITLIMLVAMTLAAIALMRSVDTANMVAGNLAFQQAAYNVADTGTEQAIVYLKTIDTQLECDSTIAGQCPQGYKSWHEAAQEPPNRTWNQFWSSMISGPGVRPLSGLPDGYSGAFVIEALCGSTKQLGCTYASVTNLSPATDGQNQGSTIKPGGTAGVSINVPYYRITTRVEGPRNSIGYVQTVIAW